MDTHAWRREIDKLADIKGMLVTLNPSLEDQTSRQIRQLFDVFATFQKLENDLNDAGFLSKRKIQGKYDKVAGEFEEDFMRVTRDFIDHFRKEYREIMTILPSLEGIMPKRAKEISKMSFPSVGTGDLKDVETLHKFIREFSNTVKILHQEVARDVQSALDENKRTVETYERHITIDTSEVSVTASNDQVSHLPLADLIRMSEKLKVEKTYLDGRKDEVSRMIGSSLITDIEALQAYVETSARLGLELPMDFTKKLRLLARDASKASNLSTLISLENQLQTSRDQMANMLRDKCINIKHDVTSKIVAGGIPSSSELIPDPPTISVEGSDIASLLSSYQKMVEWSGRVRIGLKQEIEELLEELEKATDSPEDTGISDVVGVRKTIADWKRELDSAEIDGMIKIYLQGKEMHEEHKNKVTELIREYLERFNELATSADRVLDYAQLSKKAPKVEDLEGGIVYLLQSLKNLRDAVESGVATFRTACEQEIDAIIQDLQTIKPAYAELFMPIIVELEDGQQTIKKMDEFSVIRSEMRTIKDTILAKAKDALENLRYRLGVKIRLAAAKLMGAGVEIPKEVQEAIAELNNIGVAAETVFSLPAIARKMIELYEKKITANVIDSLKEEVDSLLKSLLRAREIGVDVESEIELLTKLSTNPPDELDDAADSFDRLEGLTTSEGVHKKIRERANVAHTQIRDALSIFEERGMSDFVQRLRGLIDRVPTQLSEESKHVNEALEVCLTLANIQEEMLDVIKSIASKDKEQHLAELSEKSSYHSTIERVYQKHPEDFSRLIYPITRIIELEETVDNAKFLDEAIESFQELQELRVAWVTKAEKMDDWHKSLKMFLSGFSPTESVDVRDKFLDDAIRKIRETYSREDISSYLTWAIREIAQTMVDKRG